MDQWSTEAGKYQIFGILVTNSKKRGRDVSFARLGYAMGLSSVLSYGYSVQYFLKIPNRIKWIIVNRFGIGIKFGLPLLWTIGRYVIWMCCTMIYCWGDTGAWSKKAHKYKL